MSASPHHTMFSGAADGLVQRPMGAMTMTGTVTAGTVPLADVGQMLQANHRLLSDGDGFGFMGFQRLQRSKGQALKRLDSPSVLRCSLGDDAIDRYIAHKRGNMVTLGDLNVSKTGSRDKVVYSNA